MNSYHYLSLCSLIFSSIQSHQVSVMAGWSELPNELLEQIAKLLTSEIDILRFRSVCSSWRSTASYPPNRLPNRVYLNPKNATGQPDTGCFFLSRHLILRLGSPESPTGGWLVKLEQNVPDACHLLNPLSEIPIYPLPSLFPKVLNLLDVQISELGQEFVLHYTNKRPFASSGDVYKEKVIFSSNPCWSDEGDFVLMTIHVSGKLAFFSFRDNVWTVIEDLPSPYDDVIHHKGQFYAVDHTGRAVVVNRFLTAEEIAGPVFGGDKKYLVELDGDLFLVDRYFRTGRLDDDNPSGFLFNSWEDSDSDDDIFGSNITVNFKVFKLDQCVEKNWVEVKSLGDRVLFLGDNCSFSARASDFRECKGNCIYFSDKSYLFRKEEDGHIFKFNSVGFFDLENGSIEPLSPFSVHSQLFWPPPAWILPSACSTSAGRELYP